MKKFYFKVNDENLIEDVVEYSYEGYQEVELDMTHLPAGVNGGWWKLENDVLVEYPELRPIENQEDL